MKHKHWLQVAVVTALCGVSIQVGAIDTTEESIYGTGAIGQTVSMHGSSAVMKEVIAAHDTESADNNSATLSDGVVADLIAAAQVQENGKATQNQTVVNGGMTSDAYGALGTSGSSATITANTLTVNNGVIMFDSAGGRADFGSATKNKAIVTGGIIANVGGATSFDAATLQDNTVQIQGGTVGTAYGAYSYHSEAAADKSSTVTQNAAVVSGGIVGLVVGGANKQGNVTNNTVTVTGGTIGSYNQTTFDEYYKKIISKVEPNRTPEEIKEDLETVNKLNITGIIGGITENGNATGNTVNITGGTFSPTAVIYGGLSSFDTIKPNSSYDVKKGNTLNIHTSGLTIRNIGNFETYNFYLPSTMKNGDIVLTLTDTEGTDVSNSHINAGLEGASPVLKQGDTVTLLHNGSGITTTNVTYGKLQQGVSLAYDVTAYTGNDGKSVLATVGTIAVPDKDTESKNTESKDSDDSTNHSGLDLKEQPITDQPSTPSTADPNTNVNTDTNATVDTKTDADTKIDTPIKDSSDSNQAGNTSSAINTPGVIKDSSEKDNSVKASGIHVLEQTKSPVETRVAVTQFLNSGADLLAGQGLIKAMEAAKESSEGNWYVAMAGNRTRVETGSHATVYGYNTVLGYAKQNGQLMWGPFVEAGWGHYNSVIDDGIQGKGHMHYVGTGVLSKKDFKNGTYLEGSVRIGQAHYDYKSGDLVGAIGRPVDSSYDGHSTYYGSHIGLGQKVQITPSVTRDIYGKLFYTHQNADTVRMNGLGNGELYHFDAVNSLRGRLGVRFTKSLAMKSAVYAGLAYEYEFLGKAKASIYGYNTPSPSIKGASGLLEVGYTIQANKNVSVDVSAQGWTGKKRGIGGYANFVWHR